MPAEVCHRLVSLVMVPGCPSHPSQVLPVSFRPHFFFFNTATVLFSFVFYNLEA